MNSNQDTDEEFDLLMRQMFDETPTPSAPVDLARRARGLAATQAARELARIERLRIWAFGLTAVGLIAIAAITLHITAGYFDLSGMMPSSSSSLAASYQLLFVTVVVGFAAAIGALFILPALSSSEE